MTIRSTPHPSSAGTGAGATAKVSPRHKARRTSTDKKITDGLFRVLRTRGLHGLSIEAVAAESGVSKTTIYRRYTDRHDMLMGVTTGLTISLDHDYPLTAEGLAHLLSDIYDIAERHGGGRVISALLVDDRDETATLRSSLINPIVSRIRTFFTAGIDAGALRTDADADLLVDLFVGGIVVATCRGDLDLSWVTSAVSFMWPMLAETSENTGTTDDTTHSA